MKVSGFTLIRNGIRFDYPFIESFRSILPVVDEFIINVGKGDDLTLDKIQEFAREEGQGKVHFFESNWQLNQPEKKKGGIILSEQTNVSLDHCTNDWCFYLQADEVLHENDYPIIRNALSQAEQRTEVEGILFDYLHFYGSFDVIQHSRSTYRREIRILRKSSTARSIGDAQSFRKKTGEKLAVIQSNARVFHYGWVRAPDAMKEKTFFLDQLYHGDPQPEHAQLGIPHTGNNYVYKKIWGLRPFSDSHPQVMKSRIQNKGWHWDLAHSPWVFTWGDLKKIALDGFESLTGHRLFEYRSYKLLR